VGGGRGGRGKAREEGCGQGSGGDRGSSGCNGRRICAGEAEGTRPAVALPGCAGGLRPLAAALLSGVVRLLPEAAAEWFAGLKDRSQQRRAEAFRSSALTPLLVAREAKLVRTPAYPASLAFLVLPLSSGRP